MIFGLNDNAPDEPLNSPASLERELKAPTKNGLVPNRVLNGRTMDVSTKDFEHFQRQKQFLADYRRRVSKATNDSNSTL
jgi:hypothetical protein